MLRQHTGWDGAGARRQRQDKRSHAVLEAPDPWEGGEDLQVRKLGAVSTLQQCFH